MALLFRLSLPLLLVPLIPTDAAHSSHSHSHYHHHSPAGGAAVPLVHPRRHHRSAANTATALFYTAPSMHQNHIEAEEGQSLHVLDPFATAAAALAPSGEGAIAAVGAVAEEVNPTLIDSPPPQSAAPPPPPPSPPAPFSAPDLDSTAPSQPQEEGVEGYASATAPLPLDEPAAATTTTTTTLPLPRYRHAGPGVAASGDEQRLEQLARVLASLGYNEMASATPLLPDQELLVRWPGAITVFAAPDVFLDASCRMCSRRHVLLEHIALGYFPYSDLTAAPTAKLPSASPGFCLNLASEQGPFAIHHARLYVDGVEVSNPELYNDGRYVVHGLHGVLPPLSHGSCSHGSRHHHHRIIGSSTAMSAATAASVVRIMIREAIARLRDGGYGFVALTMRVKFAELEKLTNMTVFALEDQAIFVGGGHDYVSAVRFHIVPGHRLTHADLMRLHPGTMLPTLAGEGQNLVVTQGATGSGSSPDDVRINYVPIKDPDVVINSRIALHGVYVPFPRLHLANLAAAVALASSNQINGPCGVRGPFGDCASPAATSTTVPAAHGYGEGQ